MGRCFTPGRIVLVLDTITQVSRTKTKDEQDYKP